MESFFSLCTSKQEVQKSVASKMHCCLHNAGQVVSSSENTASSQVVQNSGRKPIKFYNTNYREYGALKINVQDGHRSNSYEVFCLSASNAFRGIKKHLKSNKTELAYFGGHATHICKDPENGDEYMFREDNIEKHPTDDSLVTVSSLDNRCCRDFILIGLAETPMIHLQLKNYAYIYLSQDDIDDLTPEEKHILGLTKESE
jgi:hypothetical protein